MRALSGRVTSFSYQSPIPADAGTPRFENPELRFYAAESHGGFCHAQAPPQRGTSPRATFSPPRPSWSAGDVIFVPIAHPGLRRHTKV